MDFFASHGWLVCAPDYFQGDPVTLHRKFHGDTETEPGFDFEKWKNKHFAFAVENVPRWVDAVKEKYGSADSKYATVGYCFGAPFVLDECAKSTVSAGAIAHPAFCLQSQFEKCQKPLLLSCAEIDHTFPAESRHIAEKILVDNKRVYHFQLFSGVQHGFALRGDMNLENERWAKEESANRILSWFERFCN